MFEALSLVRPFYRNALILYGALAALIVLWMLAGSVPQRVAGFGELLTDQGLYKVSINAPSQIDTIFVKNGAVVKQGDLLLRLKQQDNNEVRADTAGRVIQINVAQGDAVDSGQSLIVIDHEAASDHLSLDLYIPISSHDRIVPGMKVDIEPYTVDKNLHGWLIGEVLEVDDFVASRDAIMADLQNRTLLNLVIHDGPVYRIRVKLSRDESTATGYRWSDGKGPSFKLHAGNICTAFVHIEDKAPIDYLIPIFKGYFQ
ncbi:MAG: biotin/lipoyl-binding protein [Marinosulfonomonas sp.]|nr:biotin/lipoyl-binding protein [Marinosulfonomonas sp.]